MTNIFNLFPEFLVKKERSSPFSDVYRLRLLGARNLYLKFFLFPEQYQIKGFDLSPIFSRDRLMVSRYYRELFLKSSLRFYINKLNWHIEKLNLLIASDFKEGVVLSTLIHNDNLSSQFYGQFQELSQKLIKTRLISSELDVFDNFEVLKLKMDLQVKKPLRSYPGHLGTEKIMKSLGEMRFINHGDFQPKNLIVFKNKLRIIDFEEGFIGPLGWDYGFLWGNTFYLSAEHKHSFQKFFKIWGSQIGEVKRKQLLFNIVVFTASAILMRLYFFPLYKISDEAEQNLLGLIKDILKLKQFIKSFKNE